MKQDFFVFHVQAVKIETGNGTHILQNMGNGINKHKRVNSIYDTSQTQNKL